MPTAADLIARRLHAAGCRHAFGIPGGEVLALMNALDRVGIGFTLCKHENGGGFMAEGTYHATGAPGILLATIGPGLANAVNVIANAWQDRVPLIVLTGCVDEAEALTYTHQVFDHRELLRPITKATLAAADGAVDVAADKAISLALDGQPGPVHIDLAIGLADKEQPERSYPTRAKLSPTAPAPGPDLERARAMLAEAERPVMVAGLDVLHQGAADSVARFCRTYSVPLLTSYKAKGLLPEDDPLSLGGHGLSPKADGFVMPILEQADLIVGAGYDPIEMRTAWRDPWDPDKLVEFVAVPNSHYMHHASLSFVCHVGEGLAALAEGVAPRRTWPNGQIGALKRPLDEAFAANGAWGPGAVFDTLRKAMPKDSVATVDSGAHRILLSQMWHCYEPGTLLQSSGLCTMGCALPLAVGYKLAKPERPVVAVTGDAGLEMILGELATLRDRKLPVVVVVLVDESLALIEMKQRRSGLDNLGVDFGGTDFAGVAEAMGGVGRTVGDRESLEREIGAALKRDCYSVLACRISPKAYDGTF